MDAISANDLGHQFFGRSILADMSKLQVFPFFTSGYSIRGEFLRWGKQRVTRAEENWKRFDDKPNCIARWHGNEKHKSRDTHSSIPIQFSEVSFQYFVPLTVAWSARPLSVS